MSLESERNCREAPVQISASGSVSCAKYSPVFIKVVGGEVAKRVKHFNQGGTVWTFKLPKRYQQVAKN